VKQSAQREFFSKLSSQVKQLRTFPDLSHAVFHEKDREPLITAVRDFVRERFAEPPNRPALLDADESGYTKAEYDRLCRPGGLRFTLTKLSLKSVGRLSRGIRLGWQSGFDSGVTLDYVYANKPQGVTPLGRLIDRNYLNSIGWRGIRQRRVHLEKLLLDTIERTHAAGRPVRLLDIASGPGRYVLETIHSLRHIPITATLRDYKLENLEAARKIAGQLGLKSVTIAHGDAFDRASLAAIRPRPTVAIVSGLYELFPDNEAIVRSLRGLADAVEPGGHLIYTNQPWHPQVEFIARVLTNREGRPWIMRRRTQAEMDELVRTAGFTKLSQEVDPWGIFTVSVARRDPA
jgi:SAM-dependent methyltransferase